ncbi:helix-turn-helix transcriptional regulator [Arcanobacterium hippocoleae]|uniref:helix-turn-helix transcriptional regulator n=1 Tax=Arcanobacterium hippocoleae TaxID=149017 RepID=UPI0033406A90
MDTYMKERVCELRRRGCSYGQIALDLGISRNTVKSICVRHKELIDVHVAGQRCCEQCGKPLDQRRAGQRFCSTACRMAWWKTHPERLNRKALYTVVCARCGQEFVSYGNAHRKYCCHRCYVLDRFKGAKGGRP